MKVFFQFGNGNVAVEEISLGLLAECGILRYKGAHFVFAYFVHGENAVQFTEAQVCDV